MSRINLFVIIVLIFAVIVRVFLSLIFSPHLQNGQYVSFDTTLLREPNSHPHYNTATVDYSNNFGSTPITLSYPSNLKLHYGDFISVNGKIKYIKLKNNRNVILQNVPSNQYTQVIQNTKTIMTISFASIEIHSEDQNQILAVSSYIRQKFQQIYEKSFSQNLSALMLGIILGIRVNFPKIFLQQMQITGVIHVTAAEGLNVILVASFLQGIFLRIFKRQQALALVILGLIFYCVICGLSPSIVRSTIMMSFALGAQLIGRQYSSLYGLILAGSGMLLYNPSLLFDVGFQLSFGATAGIFYLKPLLPKLGVMGDDINTTLAAQMATLPIMIGSFGSYGLLSIPANAFILWTIPPLMVIGGIGGLIGLLLEPLGRFILLLAYPILFYFEKIIAILASFPWQINFPEMPIELAIGYYLILISAVLLLSKKKYHTGY